MEKGSTFNRLVSELSLDERNDLLTKLNSQSDLSKEPLYPSEKEISGFDLKTYYERMPWYMRLWYVLLGLFKSSSPVKVYEDNLISKIGTGINTKTPGLFDYHDSMLLPEFHRALLNLKDASRFFYNALDVSVNRDKGTFFAFLASLEMGDIHRRLTYETNPRILIQKYPKVPNSDLQQMASKNMDEIFSSISETERNIMYYNARSLQCLKELSSFLFDRLLMAFSFEPSVQGQVCSAKLVKEQLINLNNILFSFSGIPSISLLESLFIFVLQEQMGNIEFDVEAETKILLSQAEAALTTIRQFNQTVPLTRILRCVTRDLNLNPRSISGGEDWFVVYRDYWKKQIDDQFAAFSRERRKASLIESFGIFLKGASLTGMPNLYSEANPEGIPAGGALGLSFLSAFYSEVFIPDINPVLRVILLDGEFYKRDNRTDFTEAYNDLMKIDDTIKNFKDRLSVSGDYGKRYALAKSEIASLPVKRRKIQLVTQEVSEEIQEIIRKTQGSLKTMADVLQGINKREAGSRYDTLTNISSLPNVKGRHFPDAVLFARSKLEEASRLLEEVNTLEADQISKIGDH